MSSKEMKSYLPVPEIVNEEIRHSTKKKPKSNPIRPPKLKPKHFFGLGSSSINISDTSLNGSLNLSSAHVISFKENSSLSEDLSKTDFYDRTISESYFEQCFEIISKIGEGSFAEVFKVRNKADGLLYAVKKSKQLFRSHTYRQERLEEVRRYEQFSEHDNCVTLYKAWVQDDRLFMQMELCEGSLEDYLTKKKHVPEEKVWSVLLDLLSALKSLHDRNLIHLDIKLDNILIGDDGLCRLGDFGLVVDVDKANSIQATEGDCRYIAPELMQGHFSKAADIFSLGIAVLEFSCNLELPPNGLLWQQLRSGIFPEDLINCISFELRDIIKSMMDPNPMKRPNVDQLVSHPKVASLQQRRRRWAMLRKIKQSYLKTKKMIIAKMCNLKTMVFSMFLHFLNGLRIKQSTDDNQLEERTDASKISINENDSFMEEFLNGSNLNDSPQVRTYKENAKIMNSTPLRSRDNSIRSAKKDLLSKIAKECCDMKPMNDRSPQQDYIYLSPEYSNNSSSSNRHGSSMLIGKKLCFSSGE